MREKNETHESSSSFLAKTLYYRLPIQPWAGSLRKAHWGPWGWVVGGGNSRLSIDVDKRRECGCLGLSRRMENVYIKSRNCPTTKNEANGKRALSSGSKFGRCHLYYVAGSFLLDQLELSIVSIVVAVDTFLLPFLTQEENKNKNWKRPLSFFLNTNREYSKEW